MNRRTFITQAGVIGAAALLPSLASCAGKKREYKLGLQLFSIHQNMTDDAVTTLKAVKAMGYQDFEIFGFDPAQVTYYGFKAADFKKVLDDLELTVTSGHYAFAPLLTKPLDELKFFVDQCIKGATALGSKYITWPLISPEERTLDHFKMLAERLNIVGEQVNAAGLGFAHHNHGYEFDPLGDTNGYEIILADTDPDKVKLEMDMYWVMHSAKQTPKELVARQPGRYVMWHIKDMHKVSRDYTELGNGSIDYTTILPDPVASGLEYYYIEQGGNFTHNAMQSAADSAKYFKENLQQLI